MTVAFALFEVGSLFTGVLWTTVMWARPGGDGTARLLLQALALPAACCLVFYLNDLYDFRIVRSFRDFFPRLLQSLGIAFMVLTALYAFLPKTVMTRGLFVAAFLVIGGLVAPQRAVCYALLRRQPFVDRVLILGSGLMAEKLVREIEPRPGAWYSIVGIADDTAGSGDWLQRYPLFGPLKHLRKIIEELRPTRIIVALSERRGRLPVPELLESRGYGIMVEDGASVYERLTGKLAIEALSPSSIIFSEDFRKSRLDLAMERGFSLAVAVAGLVVLAPLFALIAVAIRLESRGPVLFVQTRAGLYGRPFRLIKFRTMQPSDRRPSEWVRDNTSRITRVGRWLRRFRLDELPQLVNILRGDMNLVGPRPHPVSNVELFQQHIPYYWLRTVVRPGVTGWAQIRYGYANGLEEETEKMRYDLFYIKHLSLWFDLRILFDTVKIVLAGKEPDAANRGERA